MSSEGANVAEIDLSKARTILTEVSTLLDALEGVDLDERTALDEPPGDERSAKARQSQTLNLAADRLEYAAQLVRVQYWHVRGHADPTDGYHRTSC